MEPIESWITSILKENINVPGTYESAIKNAFPSRKKQIYYYNLAKTVAIACLLFVLSTGIVYAVAITYEKIWKEPKKYTVKEVMDSSQQNNIEKEDKTVLISEEEAKKNALNLLNQLGYEEMKITNLELKQSSTNNQEKYYEIKTNGNQEIALSIETKTGNLMGLNRIKTSPVADTVTISQKEAEEYSQKIANKAELIQQNYELKYCKEELFYSNGKQDKRWTAVFNKKYEERYDPYDSVNIYFYAVAKNQIELDSIVLNYNANFMDNEINLTQEDAKQIALEKEKQLSNQEISDIQIDLGIRKMNTYIYKLENNLDEDNIDQSNSNTMLYQVDDLSRNVWIVRIKHKKEENIKFKDTLEYFKQMDKQYFIDATTGEIIGGEDTFESINPLYH